MDRSSPARSDATTRSGDDHCLVSFDGQIIQLRNGEPFGEMLTGSVDVTTTCTEDLDRITFRSEGGIGRGSQSGPMRSLRIDRNAAAPPGHFQIFERGSPLFIDGNGTLALGGRGQSTFFTLVRLGTIRLVRHILANDWIELGHDRIIESREIRAGQGPSLSIGGTRIMFSEIGSGRSDRGDDHDPEPKDLTIRYSGWKVRRLILFRPLLYMAAFGPKGLFDCAELAVASMTRFGFYTGDIMLLTDEAHRGFADAFPDEVKRRVHVVVCPGGDVLDFLTTRFQIVNVKEAERYQPIVYVDTDVLVDSSLDPLLREIARSHLVHLFSLGQGTLMEESNYYGSALFEQDPAADLRDAEGYNSGIIAFRNVADVAGTFGRIISSIYAYAHASDEAQSHRMFYPAADQCMTNYVLHRERRGCGSLLTPWVRLAVHTIQLDEPVRRGFVHFIGGVGHTGPKIVQMERYLRMMGDHVDGRGDGCSVPVDGGNA